MEIVKETVHLFSHADEENGMAYEPDYPSAIHSSQDVVMDDTILSSHKNKNYDHFSKTLGDSLCQKLGELSEDSCNDPTIFKLPKHLRKVNEKAYEPQILAIGPYHRGKKHLMAMETQKVQNLKKLLEDDRGKKYVEGCALAMRELEKEARACYVESELDGDLKTTDAFVEMMLLDACFIVKLLGGYTPGPHNEARRKETPAQLSHRFGTSKHINFDDNIRKGGWIMSAIRRDLLLVENQLPFFVLHAFFVEMMKVQDKGNDNNICDLILHFFDDLVPDRKLKNKMFKIERINHVLDLIHLNWSPFSSETGKIVGPRVLDEEDKWGFIRCATELKEAGIKFKSPKVDEKNASSLFGIKFENGIMKIPMLKIDDNSESFFRNLIAHEQFLHDPDYSYVTDYLKFMNCLMNTPGDVELLCQSEVVQNGLGDDKVLANMFNRLSDNVTFFPASFRYYELFLQVNYHCGRRWNKWKANLRHKYFNTPWALISFIAAVFLLLLTVAQTVFTVLPYV
ncbi:UPF0481 protein At3g47200-like [Pistacia vera]|uniref:UPF0481 protein At3g47200-like n=1 Tax=Pistacia vera TaxID=55513 RepID=UPI001263CA47|nr:UPF0481 protein At3g47200-like [Pistacia vera]